MAGERRQTSVPPLRPLEGRATRRLGDGSRMSGDVHVRLYVQRVVMLRMVLARCVFSGEGAILG